MGVGDAERPEMDVLDVADVHALVDVDAPFARVARDVADQVPMGADEMDRLVGIQEAAVEDADVLRVARGDAGRIGHRRHFGFLPLGILDHQPGHGGIVAGKPDKRRPFGGAPARVGHEDRPVGFVASCSIAWAELDKYPGA